MRIYQLYARFLYHLTFDLWPLMRLQYIRWVQDTKKRLIEDSLSGTDQNSISAKREEEELQEERWKVSF